MLRGITVHVIIRVLDVQMMVTGQRLKKLLQLLLMMKVKRKSPGTAAATIMMKGVGYTNNLSKFTLNYAVGDDGARPE